MALAVLDFDFNELPDTAPEASYYEGALILLRVDGRPAGQAVLRYDRANADRQFADRLYEAADSAFWEAWLRHRIGLPPPGPISPAQPSVTVAICTRDRTDDLERCLVALMAMPNEGQVVMVIDNAPSDDSTRDLVSSFPTVSYVREERGGLDIARNCALNSATTEVVAFIDDDAAPDPLWLRTLIRNFDDPRVMAATGVTMPMELETDAQIGFQRLGGFGRGFKRIIYDATNCDPYEAWHAGAGVNMALRRSCLEVIGPFDEALDAGTTSLAGGDSDMYRRIIAAGYQIIYDPEALNWHRHRRTMAELERQIYGYEVAALAGLTKSLVFERNWAAAGKMIAWFARQVRALLREAQVKPELPFSIAAAQTRGGLAGPRRYLQARRKLRSTD